jgi:hypothetical protein
MIDILPHPPYSQYLVPRDFFFFARLKEKPRVRRLLSDEVIVTAIRIAV